MILNPDGMMVLSESIFEMVRAWELQHNYMFCMCWRSDNGEYYIRWRFRDARNKWRSRLSVAEDHPVSLLMQPMLAAADKQGRVLSQVCQAENNGRLLVYTLDAQRDPPVMEYMALEPDHNIAVA